MERRTFIKTLLLSSGTLLFASQNLFSSAIDSKTIKILMVYNNIGSFKNLESAWGLSIWIEDRDTAILFDTGGDPTLMLRNLSKSKIDTKKLSKIVISHNHWDHIKGLSMILEKSKNKPDIFVPRFDLGIFKTMHPKAKLIGIESPIQINDFLWSTGQMKGSTVWGDIHEQSVIIDRDGSIILLTGCSHPGIIEIVEKTKKIHPGKNLNLIIGGFHLLQHSTQQIKEISAKLNKLQVDKLAPSHCTGETAINIFKDEWKEKFIDFNIGNILEI
jgi:7,8-dihydropterin-6-yl-methyl-4-(beta-D-ribofuranosyl)aminobenzene 5'-phosphate synthase